MMANKNLYGPFYFIVLPIIVLSIFITCTLLNFVETDTTISDYTFNVNENSSIYIKIPPFNTADRIYLIFNTSSRVEITTACELKQLPYDIEGLTLEFEDWLLLQQRFCYIANQNSSNCSLQVKFLDPKFPYIIRVLEGEVNYTIFKDVNLHGVNYACVSLRAPKNQPSRHQQIVLIYPYHENAEQNFQIEGTIMLLSGKIRHMMLFIITRDRNWLPYQIAKNEEINATKIINFNINMYNQTIYGHSLLKIFNKQIWYIALTIGLDSERWEKEGEAYASIGIGEIKIQNGKETTIIKPKVSSEYAVNCKVYVFHKFHPNPIYVSCIMSLTCLLSLGALTLTRITGSKSFLSRLFKPLVTKKAISDPRPNTYI